MGLSIRPIIVVEANPKEVEHKQIMQLSARIFDKSTLSLMEVSRIYMTITSLKDGKTVWPLEVIRKNASGFDIGIGTQEMKQGHSYLVRVSNNWNLSPSASTVFTVKESQFPIIALLPIALSPLFIRKYQDKGIRDVEQLTQYLKEQGLTDEQIKTEIQRILEEVQTTESVRIPIDLDRKIVNKKWITQMDHRVCQACFDNSVSGPTNDGVWPWDDPNAPELPEHPNCLLPDTLVQIPDGIISGVRAWYDGPVIEILTSKGASLTVTPNHLFLTPQGFIAADFLREGDNIINCISSKRPLTTINPDDDRKPITIKQVFDSLIKSPSTCTTTVPPSPEYLHNDAMFSKGNIDIIRPNSLLSNTLESSGNKHSQTCLLYSRDSNLFSLSSQSSYILFLNSVLSTNNRLMSSTRKTEPFLSTCLRHTQKHGFTSSSRNYVSSGQPSNYTSSSNPKTIRESLNRFSHIVEPDNIISINIKSFSGHVYDLQTPSTLYFGNDILISNCRCTYDLRYAESRDDEFRASAIMSKIPDLDIPLQALKVINNLQ